MRQLFLNIFFLIGFQITLLGQDQGYVTSYPGNNSRGLINDVMSNLNKSSGALSLSLPITTLSSHQLKDLDVFISYNATGIKVDDENGIIGLNWQLIAGGQITRVVNDLPDERIDGYINHSGTYMHRASKGEVQFDIQRISDKSADDYFFSFMGNNGRFSILPNGLPVCIPRSDLRIRYTIDAGNITSWEIMDSNGFRYIFDLAEHNTSIHEKFTKKNTASQPLSEASFNTPYYLDLVNGLSNVNFQWDKFVEKAKEEYVATWHLTKVYDLNEELLFELGYRKSGKVITNQNFREKLVTNTIGVLSNTNYPSVISYDVYKSTFEYQPYYLSFIRSEKGELRFFYKSILSYKDEILTSIQKYNRDNVLTENYELTYKALQNAKISRLFLERINKNNDFFLSLEYHGLSGGFWIDKHYPNSPYVDAWGYFKEEHGIQYKSRLSNYSYRDIEVGSPNNRLIPDLGSTLRGALKSIENRFGKKQSFAFELNQSGQSSDNQSYMTGGLRLKEKITEDNGKQTINTKYSYTNYVDFYPFDNMCAVGGGDYNYLHAEVFTRFSPYNDWTVRSSFFSISNNLPLNHYKQVAEIFSNGSRRVSDFNEGGVHSKNYVISKPYQIQEFSANGLPTKKVLLTYRSFIKNDIPFFDGVNLNNTLVEYYKLRSIETTQYDSNGKKLTHSKKKYEHNPFGQIRKITDEISNSEKRIMYASDLITSPLYRGSQSLVKCDNYLYKYSNYGINVPDLMVSGGYSADFDDFMNSECLDASMIRQELHEPITENLQAYYTLFFRNAIAIPIFYEEVYDGKVRNTTISEWGFYNHKNTNEHFSKQLIQTRTLINSNDNDYSGLSYIIDSNNQLKYTSPNFKISQEKQYSMQDEKIKLGEVSYENQNAIHFLYHSKSNRPKLFLSSQSMGTSSSYSAFFYADFEDSDIPISFIGKGNLVSEAFLGENAFKLNNSTAIQIELRLGSMGQAGYELSFWKKKSNENLNISIDGNTITLHKIKEAGNWEFYIANFNLGKLSASKSNSILKITGSNHILDNILIVPPGSEYEIYGYSAGDEMIYISGDNQNFTILDYDDFQRAKTIRNERNEILRHTIYKDIKGVEY